MKKWNSNGGLQLYARISRPNHILDPINEKDRSFTLEETSYDSPHADLDVDEDLDESTIDADPPIEYADMDTFQLIIRKSFSQSLFTKVMSVDIQMLITMRIIYIIIRLMPDD